MMKVRAVCLCHEKGGRREMYYCHQKRCLRVIVIKYSLIGGCVIWVALFLIVVSLGLESRSCSHQQLPRSLFLSLVLVHPRLSVACLSDLHGFMQLFLLSCGLCTRTSYFLNWFHRYSSVKNMCTHRNIKNGLHLGEIFVARDN
jgi:hypothetical protein